jgi:hypothetical protein
LPKTPPGGNAFPRTASREGEFTFSRATVTKAPDGRFVVELTDEEGHVVHVAFKGSDLKSLIGWQVLMGL